MRSLTILTLLAAFTAPTSAEEEPTLDWGNVHAVVVCLLEWQHPGWSSFSDEDRQDHVLAETLLARGVPEEQLHLVLDEAATREAIEEALRQACRAADEEATLLFYYAGHGQRVDGACAFASYDANEWGTGLGMDRVAAILEEHFNGARLLAFADCCHSGALSTVVQRLRDDGVPGACVTSAVPEETSTGNWTFTQTLIEVLAGDPTHDDDGDGFLELDELHDGVRDAMAYREAQRSDLHVAGVVRTLRLAPATAPRPDLPGAFAAGQHVRLQGRRAGVGRVLGAEEGRVLVRSYSYASHRDRWHPAESLTALSFPTRAVGDAVQVRRGADRLPGVVLLVDGPFHRVGFPWWPELEPRWILGDRLRDPDPEAAPLRPCYVEWQGSWYPAVIEDERDGEFFIHYLDHARSWDEWVPPARLRLAGAPREDSDG